MKDNKTLVVHTRVTPSTKKQCDEIFDTLGITTSYAITMFLKSVILNKGFPFDVVIPKRDTTLLQFAENVNSVDGVEIPDKARNIIKLYENGDIDYETVQLILGRMYAK